MSETPSFMKMVPGFEFLQGMVKNAGAAMPAMGQWVAPTLNLEELEKRINELRTVQFWLEQNARLLGTTIQALEVQRMTLSTLKTMNVSMTDLRESMMLKPQAVAPSPAPSAFVSAFASPPPPPAAAAAPAPEPAAAAEAEAPPPGVVDPMQWWSALTKQFGELAASAIAEMPRQAATTPAPAPAPAAAAKKTAAPRKAAARKPAAPKAAAPAPAAKVRKGRAGH